jgi:S-adenosylmethionine synthetase
VSKVFSFKPANIIKQLDLLRPIYRQTTNYGHFGKADMTWEQINKIGELLSAAR